MKNQKTLIAGLALALTFGVVSFSGAHNQKGGHMMGQGMMHGQQAATLTESQQKEVQAIEAKYATELTAKETAIRTKGAELDKALADGSTTISQADKLRSELYTMEQEYWQLRDQVNREISTKVGTTYYGSTNWGPGNCPWHDSHQGNTAGRGMMHGQGMMGQGMGSGYMNGQYCRW